MSGRAEEPVKKDKTLIITNLQKKKFSNVEAEQKQTMFHCK